MKTMLTLAIALFGVLLLADASVANGGIEVAVDIKPQSCPNPFNFDDKGVLPVAILGTDDLDVTMVDPASVQLEGVAPLRWSFEDVASPCIDNFVSLCPCNEEGPDGYLDLTLKFSAQEVAAAIGYSSNGGEYKILELHGVLMDGSPLGGTDCVSIVGSMDDGITKKVTMCHRGIETIRAGVGSVPAHLKHGDTLGACP